MTRRRDSDSLPRPLAIALALVALAFVGLWAKHHGFLELGALRDALRAERFALRQIDFVGGSSLDAEALWRTVGIPAGTPLVDVDPTPWQARWRRILDYEDDPIVSVVVEQVACWGL